MIHDRPRTQSARRRGTAHAIWLLTAICLLAASGCVAPLDTSYGTVSSRFLSTSVNGVDVLAGMFEAEGHQTLSRGVIITPRMDDVQTVVWFPDDFSAPKDEVCAWFDEWLAAAPGRTLIYVGRGFDAEPRYWNKVAPQVPADRQDEYRAEARSADRVLRGRASDPKRSLKCDWFEIKTGQPRDVDELAGPWSNGVDAPQAELIIADELKPLEEAQPLLSTGDGEPLVWRHYSEAWDDSQLIVVANGSFLLNLALVNPEARLLAGKLVGAVESPGRVVLLHSRPGGPPIDPPAGGSALARLFGAWPLNVILLHLAVLGIIFCFARWPILGRPKTPPEPVLSDFGMHVEAVSQLLKRTHDRQYALARLPEDADAAKADAAGAASGIREAP